MTVVHSNPKLATPDQRDFWPDEKTWQEYYQSIRARSTRQNYRKIFWKRPDDTALQTTLIESPSTEPIQEMSPSTNEMREWRRETYMLCAKRINDYIHTHGCYPLKMSLTPFRRFTGLISDHWYSMPVPHPLLSHSIPIPLTEDGSRFCSIEIVSDENQSDDCIFLD